LLLRRQHTKEFIIINFAIGIPTGAQNYYLIGK